MSSDLQFFSIMSTKKMYRDVSDIRQSVVWKCFVLDEETEALAKCILCEDKGVTKIFKCAKNTSSLNRHLKREHKTEYDALHGRIEDTEKNTFDADIGTMSDYSFTSDPGSDSRESLNNSKPSPQTSKSKTPKNKKLDDNSPVAKNPYFQRSDDCDTEAEAKLVGNSLERSYNLEVINTPKVPLGLSLKVLNKSRDDKKTILSSLLRRPQGLIF